MDRDINKRAKDTQTRTDFIWISAQLPAARIIEGEFSFIQHDGRRVRETACKQGQFDRHHVAEMITGYLSHDRQKTDAEQDAWFVDVWIDPRDRPDMVGFQISNGKYGRLGWQTANYETYYWGEDTSGEMAKEQLWSTPKRVKRIGDLPTESGWVRLRVPFKEVIKKVSGKSFESTGMAWLQSGGRVRWGDSGLELRTDKATKLRLSEIGMRKWWETPFNRQVFQSRTEFAAKSVLKNASNRDDLEQEIVFDAYCYDAQPKLTTELRLLESELSVLRSRAMPVLVSRRATTNKVTRLLNRGDYQDKSGPIVSPAFPEFLSSERSTSETTSHDWTLQSGCLIRAVP